jgi:hypothetical protein
MMTGVLRPSAGTIRIGGSSPHDDAAGVRRRLGALLDDHGLYARLTAREHLAYFGRLRGLAPATVEQRAQRYLGQLFAILALKYFVSSLALAELVSAWPVVVIGWIGFPSLLAFVFWYGRQKRAERRRLLALRRQLIED